ncbi:MAG: hypothetical protein ACO2OW_00675 [Minisyncoccia bacterium]
MKEVYKKTKLWKSKKGKDILKIYIGYEYDIVILIRTIDYEDKKENIASFFYEINEIDEFIENLKKAKEIAIEDKKKEGLR